MQYLNRFFFPLRESALKRHLLQHVIVFIGGQPSLISQFLAHCREKKKNKSAVFSARLKVVLLMV